MSTPASKRRRVDAANAVLRKPFHSPVIRRPDADGQATPPAPARTPDAAGPCPSARARQRGSECYSPSSPSILAKQTTTTTTTTQSPAKKLSLGQVSSSNNTTNNIIYSSSSSAYSPAPLKLFKSPLIAASSSSSSSSNNNNNKNNTTKRKRRGGPHSTADPFGALVAAHHRRCGDGGDVDGRLETARQARRIEGDGDDAALRGLVARWKAAGRAAAEELFGLVRDRVDGAGGPRAWREMRARQVAIWRGADDGGGEQEGDEEEESEPEFNMAQMLQSLNIDLSLLGYDEVEEKWID